MVDGEENIFRRPSSRSTQSCSAPTASGPQQHVPEIPQGKEPIVVPLSALRLVKRIVIFVVGGSIVVVGVAMLITPGPAIIVIPAGLSVLATEFYWAKRLRQYLLQRLGRRFSRSKDDSKDRL